jgi:hypothetical protein
MELGFDAIVSPEFGYNMDADVYIAVCSLLQNVCD